MGTAGPGGGSVAGPGRRRTGTAPAGRVRRGPGEREGGEAGPHLGGWFFPGGAGTSSPSRGGGGVRHSDPVDLAVILTTFVVIFPAEPPDKSMFASLVLGTRFRSRRCSAASRGLPVHSRVIAVCGIGSVFALSVPQRLVLSVVAGAVRRGLGLAPAGQDDQGGRRPTRRDRPWPTSGPIRSPGVLRRGLPGRVGGHHPDHHRQPGRQVPRPAQRRARRPGSPCGRWRRSPSPSGAACSSVSADPAVSAASPVPPWACWRSSAWSRSSGPSEPVAQAGEAGQADAGMFSLMLGPGTTPWTTGVLVTCGCPGTRGRGSRGTPLPGLPSPGADRPPPPRPPPSRKGSDP